MADENYTYFVTAQKSTSVTHAVSGAFTSATDLNLIVSKGCHLEIFTAAEDHVAQTLSVPLYGRVAFMQLFSPGGGSGKQLLLLMTERYDICVLQFDEASNTIQTHASSNVRDFIGRPTECGQIGIVDPKSGLIALHLYDGLLKIVPMDASGKFTEAFNVRLEELQVIDMVFLNNAAEPTICILYEDTKQRRHVRTYKILLPKKEIVDGPWKQPNVESGASMLIPLPSPIGGGVLILGQQTITYHDGQTSLSLSTTSVVWRASGRIDPDGSRILLGDHLGGLWVLVLASENGVLKGMDIDKLGETSCASAICYLGNGMSYVGSSFGDSQLLLLLPEKSQETKSYLDVLDTYINIGPIVDFCVVDLENQGRGQVVTCSGAFKDGSLRVIRNGIGINEQAAIGISGIKGLWALRPSMDAAYDKYLVMSFRSETRVLGLEDETMEEVVVEAFSGDHQTLACGNMAGSNVVQVTPVAVNVADGKTLKAVTKWSPQNSSDTGGALKEMATSTLDNEVACIDVGAMDGDSAGQTSKLAAVGMWKDMTVRTLRLPTLEQLHQCSLESETIPRSVLLGNFDGTLHLLVGLGDGTLVRFLCDEGNGTLSARKKVAIGTQPIGLRAFSSGDKKHVFAASDRPVVIYSNNGKIHYSSVNRSNINVVCPFSSEGFEDCLAVASDSDMSIGAMDEIQKLHIRKIPLGEQPRRICHSKRHGMFAVVTCRFQLDENTNGEEIETNYLRLVDDQEFTVLDSFVLDDFEQGISAITAGFKSDESIDYFVVGTAYALEDEPEPSRGRILVFNVAAQTGPGGESRPGRLELIAQVDTPGAVYSLNCFNGLLLAGVNSKIQLYEWSVTGSTNIGTRELKSKCGLHGHILALHVTTRGDYIVVGDLMKSVSLCVYKPLEGVIEEVARDFNANWMTAVAFVDDEAFIGAEHAYNLFMARRNITAKTEEERSRLEITGEFHLGEFVNCFRSGSLVMQPTETAPSLPSASAPALDAGAKPESGGDLSVIQSMANLRSSMLLGTVLGSIGTLTTLNKAQYDLLLRLQNGIDRCIGGIGGFSHSQWRAFCNERNIPGKNSTSKNFIDGDLVERFLDLEKSEAEKVLQHILSNRVSSEYNTSTSLDLDALTKMVEDLQSLH
eukprot:g8624.t1